MKKLFSNKAQTLVDLNINKAKIPKLKIFANI